MSGGGDSRILENFPKVKVEATLPSDDTGDRFECQSKLFPIKHLPSPKSLPATFDSPKNFITGMESGETLEEGSNFSVGFLDVTLATRNIMSFVFRFDSSVLQAKKIETAAISFKNGVVSAIHDYKHKTKSL